MKEVILKFRETEIEHLGITVLEKEELKSGWKQWLDATAQGIKDELRGEGKLKYGGMTPMIDCLKNI